MPGNVHDKKLYDASRTFCRGPDRNPQLVKKKGDLGYLGTACELPIKKPKSRTLTMAEKASNRQFSQKRIEVEHQLAHMKKWHCLAGRFRGAVSRYNLMFRNVAGLRNLIQAGTA